MLTELSLFTGYSGISLGVKLANINTRTIAYVEWDKYPQEIIKARIKDKQEGKFGLDDAPIFSDISSFRGEQFRGLVDLVTAGFPCQPHSFAGARRSSEDSRNKWPDTLRVISEVAPRYVLLENVSGLLSSSVDERSPAYGGVVVGELTEIGYDCFWEVVGADDAGAPHRRKRWFCFGVLADSEDSEDLTPSSQSKSSSIQAGIKPRGSGRPSHELVNPTSERTGRIRDESDEEGTRYSNVLSGVSGGIHTGNLADSEGRQSGESQTGNWGEGAERGSTELADCNTISTWPPSPTDAHAWERVIRERPDLAPALTKKAESQFRGVVDGRSHRVDELKALGNGVVPAVVALFLRRLQ